MMGRGRPSTACPDGTIMTASIGANGTGTSFRPPPRFEEYRVGEPLGRGGMGEVYSAYDTILERTVAVKFISGLEPSQTARERFLVEARAAARLQHPNVVTIYRVGELGDRPFIISELVHGKGLDTLPKPMDFTRALELGKGLARGLAAAHRRDVLHRDIKPANAILTDDEMRAAVAYFAAFLEAHAAEVLRGDPALLARFHAREAAMRSPQG